MEYFKSTEASLLKAFIKAGTETSASPPPLLISYFNFGAEHSPTLNR
jgi:hypothetical protein